MASFDDDFASHCVELLQPLGPVHARRMFGGHGIYLDDLMVGLIANEQLYLKTDAQTVAFWQSAGGHPFVYTSRRGGSARPTAMSYWTPPAAAMESAPDMIPWARLALEAALRAKVTKRPARPRPSPR